MSQSSITGTCNRCGGDVLVEFWTDEYGEDREDYLTCLSPVTGEGWDCEGPIGAQEFGPTDFLHHVNKVVCGLFGRFGIGLQLQTGDRLSIHSDRTLVFGGFPRLTRRQRLHNLRAETGYLWYRYVLRSKVHLRGRLTLTALDRYGRVVAVSPTYCNLIVTVGKNLVLDRLFGLSSAVALTSVGVGTDSTAAAVGQTQLNPTVAGSVLLQTADAGTSRSAQTVTIASTYGTGVANFSWNEIGLFNGNTNGTSTMFNRIVIGPFNKTTAVTIIAQLQISQS